MRLTIIRGLPGSGKTTYAKQHFDCLHLENDMMWITDGRYEFKSELYESQKAQLRNFVKTALLSSIDVVVSSTFVTLEEIKVYKQIADWYLADFKVLRCSGCFPSKHCVPAERLTQMAETFEDYPGEEFG